MTELPPQTDIAELFSRDPLSHSKQDVNAIIAKFREMRGQYNLGAAMAGSTKPKSPRQKQVADLATKLKLDLDF